MCAQFTAVHSVDHRLSSNAQLEPHHQVCQWLWYDMTVVGLINMNNESVNREEVKRLKDGYKVNSLSQNVNMRWVLTSRNHGVNTLFLTSTDTLWRSSRPPKPLLVPQRQFHSQESPAASLLSLEAEENPFPITHPHHVLQRDNQKHSE